MIDLKPVPSEVLHRREEAYQKHLDLVSNPHANRYRLAGLLNSAGYTEVTPEHFEGARLATGPDTRFDRDSLQEMYGIAGILYFYPSTILVANWDEYTNGSSPKTNIHLIDALKIRTQAEGATPKIYYPIGSEMPIKLSSIKTPHEDFHHARRLVRGKPTNISQLFLEELQATHPDVMIGIRTWDDIKWAIIDVSRESNGYNIRPETEEIIRHVIGAVKSMESSLTPREIQYLFLASLNIKDLSEFLNSRNHVQALEKLKLVL
ncbi:MAG: hypothetical protein HY361_01845 [Candidatus Aenigmarchaeota archaeon]|nr:hypothetical protein [Candidatus Aenigmarchaeota archaeon]